MITFVYPVSTESTLKMRLHFALYFEPLRAHYGLKSVIIFKSHPNQLLLAGDHELPIHRG